jgi:RNA polymerase sigma-70 factor (ECF subfamily)
VPDRVDGQVRIGRLAVGIAGLTPDDRDVLLLTAWGGLDSVEVAQALDIPVGTVRSRLHRVRRQLRTHESTLLAPPAEPVIPPGAPHD